MCLLDETSAAGAALSKEDATRIALTLAMYKQASIDQNAVGQSPMFEKLRIPWLLDWLGHSKLEELGMLTALQTKTSIGQ